MDNYFVIPFTSEDLDQYRDVWFILALEMAVEETRRRLQSDPSRESEVVHMDVRRYRRSTALPAIDEYERYSQVYFLNDVALKVCRDSAIDIDVLKVIPKDELPDGLFLFQGPYLSDDERS
jgi:hypothetical protein